MARVGTRILDSGEPFPALTMETVAHGRLSLPDAFANGWACSCCTALTGDRTASSSWLLSKRRGQS